MKEDYLVISGRGCICSCSFCCEEYMNRVNHTFHRRRNIDAVINELKEMKLRYGYKRVWFIDSILFSDKKYFIDLMKKYREEIGLPFRCFGHVAFFDRDIAAALSESDCYCIEFGLQTTSELLRRNILNCSGSIEKIQQAFEICDELGLTYDIDHMFGVPEETIEDHLESLAFYRRLHQLNRIKCHNLTLYPGLSITEKAIKSRGLSSEVQKRIINGDVGNYINVETLSSDIDNKSIKGIKTIMKIYPLLPAKLLDVIIKKRRFYFFSILPGVFIIPLQLIIAIKKNDYRFFYYIKCYPRWLLKALSLRVFS